MKKLAAKFLILIFVLSMSVFYFPAIDARAAGASLYVSPSSGNYQVGDVISAKVIVNSGGGAGINASDGTLTFDKSLLVVKSVTKDSSIFTLWTADPSYSNNSGTISYGGGLPSGPGKGYTGSNGILISVTFVALAPGTAKVDFSASSVLANDGMGTNILSNNSGATFTIKEKTATQNPPTTKPTTPTSSPEQPPSGNTGLLPPTPKVESATHPDPNVWYNDNNPEFHWKLLPDISAVSFSIDLSSSTDPGKKSDGIIEAKFFSKVADGKEYFHVKFQNKSGWGPTTHRQFLVDTMPPTEFVIDVDNGGDPTNPTPKLSFTTTDVTSGIKSYEINLDGEKRTILSQEYQKTPYALPVLKPGLHNLIIGVSDQAGNMASSSREFTVEALKAPVITEMPSIIYKGDQLAIQGTSFYPNATIKIYLGTDEKNMKELETKTDLDGNWTYFQQSNLSRGNYRVWAKVIDARGAESNESMKKSLSVQSPSLICAYGLWIIILLILAVIGMAALLVYRNRQNKKQRLRAIREAQELEKRLNEIFAALKEEVNELMEVADKKAGYSESEKRVRDKVNEALDISQEFISKEIKDVEKEIE